MSTRTKVQIASQLKLQNIVTLVQTSLQQNFKLLAETLDDHDGTIINMTQFQQNTAKNLSEMNQKLQKQNNQHNSLKKQLSDLKNILFQNKIINQGESNIVNKVQKNALQKVNNPQNDLMETLNQLRKQMDEKYENISNQTNKNNTDNRLNELEKELSKLKQEQTKNEENSVNKLKQLTSIIMGNDKQMNNLKQQATKLKKQINSHDSIVKKLNQQLFQLQQNYEGFKADTFQNLSKQVQQNNLETNQKLQNLQKMINEQDRLRGRLAQEVYQAAQQKQQNNTPNLQLEIANDNIKRLQMDLSDLAKKVKQINLLSNKYDDSQSKYNKTSKFNQTTIQTPIKYAQTGSKETNRKKQITEQANTVDYQNLREQLFDKLHDLRNDLLRSLKKLQNKSDMEDQGLRKKIDNFEQNILKIQYLLGDKSDTPSVKKMFTYLDNKLNNLYTHVLGEYETQQDARIAKKQWVCLSCDKKLDRYQGKVGNHLITSQLKSKALDQDAVGGGMSLKPSKSKFDLPNVHKVNQQSQRFLKIRK